jgi:putative FmdB family regulatory protein
MPIYEYRCADCSFQSEYLQKVSEPPMTVCPSCGKASFRKLLSAAGFQLKGSGWYATDFKHTGAKPAKADAAKGESKVETTSDAAKSESKAERKAEDKSAAAPACTTN